MTTRERILQEALRLFSKEGYDAVGVEQIAAAVGIKAPSLYKHYKGKQDIFDAIFIEMQKRYDLQTQKMELHVANGKEDTPKFASIDCDGLVNQLLGIVRYSIQDEFVSRFRRLLTTVQFRSPELAALYTERYVNRLVGYHEELFRGLMAEGAICEGDLHSMALQYTCPVLTLLSVCDRQPQAEAQVMKELEAHVRQFWAFTRPNKTK